MSTRHKFPFLKKLQKEARVILRRIRGGDPESLLWLHGYISSLPQEKVKMKHVLDAIGIANGFQDWRAMLELYSSSEPLGGFIGYSHDRTPESPTPYEFRCFYASKLSKIFKTEEEQVQYKKAPFIYEHITTLHGYTKFRAAFVFTWNLKSQSNVFKEENHILCQDYVFVLPSGICVEDMSYKISSSDAYWYWMKKQAADPHSYLNLAAKHEEEAEGHMDWFENAGLSDFLWVDDIKFLLMPLSHEEGRAFGLSASKDGEEYCYSNGVYWEHIFPDKTFEHKIVAFAKRFARDEAFRQRILSEPENNYDYLSGSGATFPLPKEGLPRVDSSDR